MVLQIMNKAPIRGFIHIHTIAVEADQNACLNCRFTVCVSDEFELQLYR